LAGRHHTTPVPAIIGPAEGSTFNIDSFTISGTAEAGNFIELFEESASRGTVRTNNSGQWRIELTGIIEGSHSFKAKAFDDAGNAAESEPRTVKVDATAPSAPVITSPAESSYDTDGSFIVSGTAEAESTVYLFEQGHSDPIGIATANASGAWNLGLSDVSIGSHTTPPGLLTTWGTSQPSPNPAPC